MAKVLLYNIEKSKAVKIKMLCRKLLVDTQEVQKEQFGLKLAELLRDADETSLNPGVDFDEEMLYFADINGGFLSVLIDQLKKKKVPVALKAIKTETNVNFTSYELYSELTAERAALAKRKSREYIKTQGEM